MPNPSSPFPAAAGLARTAGHWASGWWRIVHLGSLLLVLAVSPASYERRNRRAVARHVYLGTAPALLSFSVLTTLISLVVIRIVLVTALSYGLSQYALEMVVRVLVLELIPLTAALYAALRCSFPLAAQLALLRDALRPRAVSADLLARQVLPRVAAGLLCALLLAAVSCAVTLLLAYLSVYGPTGAGFASYTHTVGKVFDPGTSLIFLLKIVLFSGTVALVPIASLIGDAPRAGTSAELQGLLRMFLILLSIEGVALAANYA